MRRHDRNPDWLIDGRGHVWRLERVYTCPNHPYGPEREDGDEFTACEQLAKIVLELHLLVDDETTAAARVELGLCCKGHRWRGTGKLIEVSAYEIFVWDNMQASLALHRGLFESSVLLSEIDAVERRQGWQGVRIPLIVHPGAPLPKTAAAAAYDLNPSKPPTERDA